jgi:hypothetical protein
VHVAEQALDRAAAQREFDTCDARHCGFSVLQSAASVRWIPRL